MTLLSRPESISGAKKRLRTTTLGTVALTFTVLKFYPAPSQRLSESVRLAATRSRAKSA
jgi:hypothetical protein